MDKDNITKAELFGIRLKASSYVGNFVKLPNKCILLISSLMF